MQCRVVQNYLRLISLDRGAACMRRKGMYRSMLASRAGVVCTSTQAARALHECCYSYSGCVHALPCNCIERVYVLKIIME